MVLSHLKTNIDNNCEVSVIFISSSITLMVQCYLVYEYYFSYNKIFKFKNCHKNRIKLFFVK